MKTRACSDGALCQNFEEMGEEKSEMYVCKVTMLKAPPLPPHMCVRVYTYVNTRACANATLWRSLKAIGEEVSEIVLGSTASSPGTDVVYML
jgi:hypothetical protein